VEVDGLIAQIHKLPPVSLFLLVIGFAIARLPQFILQKDRAALEARDTLIRMQQQQILDLRNEIRELKKENEEASGETSS
jgi:hypothetical protein